MIHKPVLIKEVLKYLNVGPNKNFIDATIGEGGHALAILEKSRPNGKVLGIDWDPEQIKNCKVRTQKFKERIILVHGSYGNLKKILEKVRFGPVHGILLDLGMSSWHIERSGRGFTFRKNEPLDMRYNSDVERKEKNNDYLTAQEIINRYSENEIEKILKEYGEERFARRIAKRIVTERKRRPIKSTIDLVEIIKKAVPPAYRRKRIHYATRTFQALRIAVNNELDNLKKVLPQAVKTLEKGGRLVVISFHSLEDRIVKRFFRECDEIKILTKKVVIPSKEEIKNNPRSRSAKLRAGEKK